MHKITENAWTCLLQFFLKQKELSKAKSKMQKMSEDHKKDNEDALSRKIKEIEELKKQLQESIEEQERQAVQTQAHKQVLEKITMEKEALQVRDRGYSGQRSQMIDTGVKQVSEVSNEKYLGHRGQAYL